MKLALVGADGRMGRAVRKLLPIYSKINLVAAIENSNSPCLGNKVSLEEGVSTSVNFSDDLVMGVTAASMVVDFSTPATSDYLADVLLNNPRAAAICTTGLASKTLEKYAELSKSVPVLIASNTSLGIAVMQKLVSLGARLLGPNFDIEIVEAHHRNKKDAPSGTALSLADSLCQVRDFKVVVDRSNSGKVRSPNEIGISSLRGGDVVGEHKVCFSGDGEKIELSHVVSDRKIFARGILELITILHEKKADLYNPAKLFSHLT